MSTENKVLAFSDIINLNLPETRALYTEHVVTPHKGMETAREKVVKAKETAEQHTKPGSKTVAAMKINYTKWLADGTLPKDTTEKAFFKDAGCAPSGRVLSVAELFIAVCLPLKDAPALLKEEYFDVASGNALEEMAYLVSHEKKISPELWRDSDNVKKGIEALSRPGDAITIIKGVRMIQKGQDKKDAKAKEISLEEALAVIQDAITGAGKLDLEKAAVLFQATYYDMPAKWQNSGIKPETFQKWENNHAMGVALHMDVNAAPAPAETETLEKAATIVAAAKTGKKSKTAELAAAA